LAPIEESTQRVATVLDPEDAVRPADVDRLGQMEVAWGWWDLRRLYEHLGRRRPPDADRLVLVVKGGEFRERRDLPYDIEQATVVVEVRVPGPPWLREVMLGLQDDFSDRAAEALERVTGDPLDAVIQELWGAGPTRGDPVHELDAIIRLRSDPAVPAALWGLLGKRLQWEPARALCADPPDPAPLQRAWAAWVRGQGESPSVFEALGPRIAALFHLGLLRPVTARGDHLPGWARVGIAETSARDRLEELLGMRPAPWPPADLSHWLRAAEWWGEVRAALGEAGAAAIEVSDDVWGTWTELDQAFRPWLRENFGQLLMRSSARPLTVAKVAPFLAARVRRGEATRILLLVLDGMGLAQWSTIRRVARLKVLDASVTFALVPTLTPISRQAIFAGCLPRDFPESIHSTSREEERWKHFWASESTVSRASYARVSGAYPVPLSSAAAIHGLVLTAVDDMMHGSGFLGDAQLTAGLLTWAKGGVLKRLVEEAVRRGYEVWVTSDHGNVEALPVGSVDEGLVVETAGLRVRWYPNQTLLNARRAPGLDWTPPGLPEDRCYLVFAEGRGAYFSGEGKRIAHGGISIDEVTVPFARVEP
jgi:hypothetical protein